MLTSTSALREQHVKIEAVQRTSILFVDPGAADLYLPSLRARFEVSSVSSECQAIRALRAFQPTLVITELALPDGDGVSICRQAKAFGANKPWVLATTAVAERVPEALIAGCNGVLLKPFDPNLLYTRIGRLLQQRAKALATGTNVVWDDACCPSCGQGGIVEFDAASRGRMWYACLSCRDVWMALQPRRRARLSVIRSIE